VAEKEPVPIPNDDVLLAKVMRSVRIEIIHPMRVQISRWVRDKVTDTHTFEIPLTMDIPTVQRDVFSICGRWKGGFVPGVKYIVERIE
jgi:hypothetical protein